MLCTNHTVGNNRTKQRFNSCKNCNGNGSREEGSNCLYTESRQLWLWQSVRNNKMLRTVCKLTDCVSMKTCCFFKNDAYNSCNDNYNKASGNLLINLDQMKIKARQIAAIAKEYQLIVAAERM